MMWLLGKKKSHVEKRVQSFEAALHSEALFTNLVGDDYEERVVKQAAAAKEKMGGWASQQGRLRDSAIDRSVLGLVELFTAPGHIDGYLVLALSATVLHMLLLASWLLGVAREGGTVSAVVLMERALADATVSESSTRLSIMYACGHVIWLGRLLHACVGSKVNEFAPFYLPLMLVCVVVGGPTCAIAVSEHCEVHARLKEEHLNTRSRAYLPKDELVERRSAVSDAMQWIWLLVLATTVASSASALGSSSLMPDPSDGSYDLAAILLYVLWPLEIVRTITLGWLTPLTALVVVDWIGILLAGVLIAAAGGRQEGPALLGVNKERDTSARCALVATCSFPTPYVGLALYLLLDTRQKADNPLLPPFTGGLRGPQKPRAMLAWRAREHTHPGDRRQLI